MKDSNKLAVLFKKAVALHQSGQQSLAEEAYLGVLKLDPRHFDALQLLATLKAHLGEFAASLELFAKAIRIDDKNPKVLNNYGYVLAQTGDLDAALIQYKKAVNLDPNYLDALNNLANLSQQLGQLEHSINLYSKINRLNSNYVQAFFNKGVALQRLSRFSEALQSYEAALKLNPGYLDAALNKAIVLKETGQYEESLNIYRELLTSVQGPAAFDIHNNCGNLLQHMGRLEDALGHFDQAVMANPYQAITYSNRGNVLQRLGRFEEAVLTYGVAITVDPQNADFLSNRGNALQNTGALDAALSDYERSIELSPNHAQAYYNRGNLYKIQGATDLAINSYRLAIRINPEYSDAHNNLGNIYKDLNRLELAINHYERALQFNPLHLDALNNKGVALQRLLDMQGACNCFNAAIELYPNSTKSYVNKAIVLFLQGQFSEAWSIYERRLGDLEFTTRPHISANPQLKFPLPSNLSTTRLLVWSEQGVGDAIMFASMFEALSALVKELIVMVDRRLIELFQRSFINIQFVDKDSLVDPAIYDFHLPMASMGLMLQMDEVKIRALTSSYLRADLTKNDNLRAQLNRLSHNQTTLGHQAVKKSIICGISWSSTNPSNGLDRSLDVELLLDSIRVDGVNFVNLQYIDPVAKTKPYSSLKELDDLGLLNTDVNLYSDLDGLASLIDICDLVISIDNSTVHLSAALGKPTWVLLPLVPDWRWLLEGTNSAWYPSVQLFRQKAWGEWNPALEAIKIKLSEFVASSLSGA